MKKLLLLLSLTFIPVLNAETYYDYEKIEVEELPTASAETTDKVYIAGKSYYVTEKTLGSVTPMVIGNNMKGVTLYNAIPDNLMELDIWKNLDSCKSHYYCKGHIFNYDRNPSPLTFLVDFSNNKFILYFNGKGHQESQLIIENNVVTKAFTSSVYEYDLVFTTKYYESTVNGLPELAAFLDYIYEHVSTSSIDTTYSWKEVNKKDVYPVIENTLYVPNKNLQCYILKDRNTLRGYFNKPTLNSNADYYDFYLDQHYNSIKGTELIETDINCLDNITYNYLYRNDIVEILIFFVIVAGFVIYLPIKILFRFSRRFN